jgi:high affinity Mn2+ porin
MWHHVMRYAVLFALSLAIPVAAAAQEKSDALPTAGLSAKHNWDGFYFGGHVGFGGGNANAKVSDATSMSTSNTFGGPIGGAHLGYNVLLPSHILLGAEVDTTFPNYIASNAVIASVATPQNQIREELDYVATARGRLGYVYGPWLLYGTGGVALMGSRFLNDLPSGDEEKQLRSRVGGVVGGGAEYAFDRDWRLRLEYLYGRFASANVAFPSGATYASTTDFNMVRLGLNRKLNWSADADVERKDDADGKSPNWQIHGQTTYIQQGYPNFHSPYEGQNSLGGNAQTKNTASGTAFLGLQPWEGGEFFYAPELAQGFGLSGTLGLGGFSNGEAQKAGFPYPRYNTSRLFFRQTFGLGGEQESIEEDLIHFGGKTDVSRLSFTVGRVFLPDFIDNNAYADEPRSGFLNWSIWAAGAFDFPADQPGYSWGAFAELNQKDWAVRAGYLLMPKVSNSNYFDPDVFGRGEYLLETELRYSLLSHPGKLRLIGWVNPAYSGSYADTLANPALNLDISQTRQGRVKYGAVADFEQALSDEFGLFSRLSWNNGKTEIMSFTDIDASASFGGVLNGNRWGRPDDRIGLAGAINALSADHRAFIAAGGLGILIGDGALNYHPEKILETYYSYALQKKMALTFDYQFITNPAYNADRGPVSIFSGRLHAEF